MPWHPELDGLPAEDAGADFHQVARPDDGDWTSAVLAAIGEILRDHPPDLILSGVNRGNNAGENVMYSGTVGGAPTTVLVAGDDADAKAALVAAVQAGGLKAVDAGSLARAHELEALGFLQLTLAAAEKITWTGGFTLAN